MIYIAAPLFNDIERSRNHEFTISLEKEDFKVYLPQRDGGLFYEYIEQGFSIQDSRSYIFKKDIEAIDNSDIILCLLDGRVLDEGMCFELGYGFAKGKICIGYKTDHRTQDKFGNNIMIDCALKQIFNNRNELIKYICTLKNDHYAKNTYKDRTLV